MSSCSSLLVGIGAGVLGTLTIGGVIYYIRGRTKKEILVLQDEETVRVRQLKLFHSFPFRSCRCAWLINELGIQKWVEIIPVSLHGPDAKDLPKYKKEVHPHGTIPALVLEDGTTLLESAAICLYIAHEFSGNYGPDLLPSEDNMAEFYDKIVYATSTIDHILEPLYMQLTHTSEDERDQGLVTNKMRQFKVVATVLSDHLKDKLYICGKKFTAADCVVGYNIWWASVIKQGELLQEYPILLSYLQRLKERPSFEQTFQGKRPVKPSGGSL